MVVEIFRFAVNVTDVSISMKKFIVPMEQLTWLTKINNFFFCFFVLLSSILKSLVAGGVVG